MKGNLKTLTTMVCGLLLASTAFGFVEKRPDGAKFYPEQSQEQLGQQQFHNGQYGIVGDEQITPSKEEVRTSISDANAQNVIIGNSPQSTLSAAQALKAAEADVSKGKAGGPNKTVIWGLFFLVLGVFAVWAFRTYADKVVPEPPQKKNVKW